MKNLLIVLFLSIGTVIMVASCSKSGPTVDANGVTHAKFHLYDYACPSATRCTRTANTYIVHEMGLFMELDPEFVEKCRKDKEEGKPVNPYCNKMIRPGDAETFNGPANAIDQLLNHGPNPEEDAAFDARIEAIKARVYR
jgi:hypothetical protein